tara:strand:- start:21 stop:557 length:537 start_codon:yes stop_codon:yes gene_type:complete
MAEQFSNAIKRRCGIVTNSTGGSIGIKTNLITGISTVHVAVNDLVDNEHFLAGSKVTAIGVNSTTVDSDSLNAGAVSNQTVKYLGVTTAYKSDGTKSVLIGGTFANNTTSQVNLTVNVWDNSASTEVGLAVKIPVPNGSSFVITDTGKTMLETMDEVRVYVDTDNAIDVTASILKGVT